MTSTFPSKLIVFGLFFGTTPFAGPTKGPRTEQPSGAAPAERALPQPPDRLAQGSLSMPFEQTDYGIYLPVRVNGAGPYWFILDSGANVCVVDQARAKALGLKRGKQVKGTGAGKGTVKVWFTPNVTFALPEVRFTAPRAAVIDLISLRGTVGRDVAGILGYDLFHRFVVEVDYEAQIVRLHEPKAFHYGGKEKGLPLTFKRNLPYVAARLTVQGRPPVEKSLLVDTGSDDAVDDPLLKQSSGPKREVTAGVGLGSEYRGIIGRFQKVELGPFALESVVGTGDGVPLIGSEVLHRFTVFLDYGRRQMFLEPNRFFREPFSFDASGLSLRLTGKDYTSLQVHSVLKGSPAEAAGLCTGDIITAIDGCPAERFRLSQVQRMFAHSGREYRLAIKRGPKFLNFKIRLQKLL
jgi:hypothetical protein